MIERERRFLVAGSPPERGPPTRIRQGYLAVEPDRSVRVRERGEAWVLTMKAGTGRSRQEVGLALEAAQFKQLWPLTEGRRVEKLRYQLDLGVLVAELDVFGGGLEPLQLVEVEFGDDASAEDFNPPDWFGREVTDDPRYTNARLALDGAPPAEA